MTQPPPSPEWEDPNAYRQPDVPPGSGEYVAMPAYGDQSAYPGSWVGYPDPDDPLVTPLGMDINGWLNRVTQGVRRSWRSAAVILGLTQTLPTIFFGVLSLNYLGTFATTGGDDITTTAEAEEQLRQLGEFLGIAVVAIVVLSFVQAVGWAAGTWAMTREAAGQPAPVGDAFAYGLRRAPGVWGWTLLAGLMIAVGVCACILPGVYLAFALALVGPVYLFERDNPIGRSFRLLHANFGPVLGRLAILLAVVIAGQVLASIVENVGFAVTGVADATGITPAGVVFTVIGTAMTLPLLIVMLVGLVVTYAEQRLREAPVNTAALAAALG